MTTPDPLASRRPRRRRHTAPRCRVCGLHPGVCVCARLPRLNLPQRLILVQHAVEMDRPTNTGRMAAYFWNEGTILPYGLRGVPMNEAALQEPGWTYLLLFYRPDAIPLDDWLAQRGGVLPDRLAFVIPDGTWHQAAHMARRVRPLRDMPCVCLPPGRPGLWKIRTPRLPGQLCTAEAVIRLARWLGSADPADRMEDLLRIIQHHMLIMKGMKDEKEPAPESHTP